MKIFSHNQDGHKLFTEDGYAARELITRLREGLDHTYCLYVQHGDSPYSHDFSALPKQYFKILLHIDNEVFFEDGLYDEFDIVFRFYLHDRCDLIKVFPLPLGINCSGLVEKPVVNNLPFEKRGTNVFFMVQKNCKVSLKTFIT